MSQALLVSLEFGVCAALIAWAGWRLSLYGDLLNAYVLFRFGG